MTTERRRWKRCLDCKKSMRVFFLRLRCIPCAITRKRKERVKMCKRIYSDPMKDQASIALAYL